MDRDSFFIAQKPKTIDIALDDGRIVKARKLTQAEVETIRKSYAASESTALAGFRFIVCRCVVDDEGNRVFTDADQNKLVELDFDTIQTIASEVVEFSGLNKNQKKA